MRNEFVNSHSIKIHTRTLHFLPPAACGNVFPIKNCQNTWRSGSRLARGQMNMADEAKLHSPAHSTFFFFIQLLKHWFATCSEPLFGEKWGPFCWPMPAAGVAIFSASHQFAEHTSQILWVRWDSESCHGSDQQQTTKHFLLCKFGFRKCFGASSWPNHWAGCHQLYTIHFSSHIIVQSRNGSLLCRIREDDTSKWWLFYLQSVYEAPTYRAFSLFQFASNAKSTMSSSATSHVIIRGSAPMIVLN